MLYTFIDLFCGAIVPLIVVILVCVLRKKKDTKKTILIALFTLYLAEVFDIVGIAAIQYCRWNPILNFVPLADGLSFGFIANIILFIPFGFLLPLIWPCFRKFSFTLLAGVLSSLAIEISQLFSFRATDIDDLLTNTAGTIIGYLIIVCFARKKWTKNKPDTKKNKGNVIELAAVIGLTLLSAIFIKSAIGNYIYGLPMFK